MKSISKIILPAALLTFGFLILFTGCANQAGEDNRNVGRMAGLLAGLLPAAQVAPPGTPLNPEEDALIDEQIGRILAALDAAGKADELEAAIQAASETLQGLTTLEPSARPGELNQLNAKAAKVPVGAEGLIFCPHYAGNPERRRFGPGQ